MESDIKIKNTNKSNVKWYAVYTKPRAEKKVFERLQQIGIETFLPLEKKVRVWSDRKKVVEEPLFKSYIFVRVNYIKERINVASIDGIINFVRFSGEVNSVNDKEINTIKTLLTTNAEFELSSENFRQGDKVKVIIGSLAGTEGEVVKGKKGKVLFRMESVQQSILVTISTDYLEKIK